MFVVRGVFFFQAEDGIRDLVRSRGLGDVYKRQRQIVGTRSRCRATRKWCGAAQRSHVDSRRQRAIPVSYTHLTLPTSDLV